MAQGVDEHALAIYQALRQLDGAGPAEIRRSAGLDEAQAEAGWRRLAEIGLVQPREDGRMEPVEPDTALMRTMDAYHLASAEHAGRAASLQRTTQALLSVYRPAVGRVASKVEVEYIRDSQSKRRTVVALNSIAQHSADSLHPGPLPPTDVLYASMEQDALMIRRGVRMRAIYPQSALQAPKYARYLQELGERGVSVRVIDHSPCDMLMQDDEVACLPSDPTDPGAAMLLVRSAELVWTLGAIYDDYWLRAVPLDEALAAPAGQEAELTPQERVVIRLMATGLSDDQIARKLGVHRRTVQRAVAKLMDRLHASSRFEAGLKLAQDRDLARVLPPSRPRPPVAAG